MIKIKIKFLSLLAEFVGTNETTLSVDENSFIKDVFNKLIIDFGKKFENIILTPQKTLSKYIILGLNGKDIRSLNFLNILLQDGDEISFLPAIAGG